MRKAASNETAESAGWTRCVANIADAGHMELEPSDRRGGSEQESSKVRYLFLPNTFLLSESPNGINYERKNDYLGIRARKLHGMTVAVLCWSPTDASDPRSSLLRGRLRNSSKWF